MGRFGTTKMNVSSDSVAEMKKRRKAMEQHAVELMLDGKTNPKDAMEISGCRYQVGTTDYNRLYQKAYRKRKILEKATCDIKCHTCEFTYLTIPYL